MRKNELRMENNNFVGCTVTRNLDYSKPFSESDLHEDCTPSQRIVHIVSKTHLDLFLPNSDANQNRTNPSSVDAGCLQPPDEHRKTDLIGCNGEVAELLTENGGNFKKGREVRTGDEEGRSSAGACETRVSGDGLMSKVENATRGSGELRSPPLVVFAYGGGWRRGDKQAWRHYLSRWDTNFAIAANVGRNRLYANVGESFARRGIPCAVLSYPLVPTPFPINLLEMSISFSLSVVFTFLAALMLGIAMEIMHFLSFSESLAYIAWTTLQSYTDFPFVILSIGVVLFSQIFSVAIVMSRERYVRSTSISNPQIDNNIFLIWRAVFIGICVLLISVLLWSKGSNEELQSHTGMTATLVSGALILCVQYLLYQYQLLTFPAGSKGKNSSKLVADPYGQVKCVARALRWLVAYGQNTGHFDPSSIIVVGHSAGGHLVSLVALDHHYLKDVGVSPSCIKGVITLSAVHDLHTIAQGPFYRIYLVPAFGTDQAHWDRMSPITYARSARDDADNETGNDHQPGNNDHKPRFLIISAEKDFKIMIEDSKKMHGVLRDSGYQVDHRFMHGCDHFQMMKEFGCPWHVYWFGVGHLDKGWSPSAGEKMCWDFVREIERDRDANFKSS